MSQPSRKTKFVTVPLWEAAREALREDALQLSAAVGRQLSMSEVVVHLSLLGREHVAELVASLKREQGVT